MSDPTLSAVIGGLIGGTLGPLIGYWLATKGY